MPPENLLTALVTALLGLVAGRAAAALVPVFPPLPDDDDAGGTETAPADATTGTAKATAGTGEDAAGTGDATAGTEEEDGDEEPPAPPAACPLCGTELSPRGLAGVAVRGRCGSCGGGLRTRPAVVAGTGAVVSGLIGLRFGLHPLLPAYLFLGAVSVVLGFIDLRVKRLPNAFTLPAYPIGLLLLTAAAPLVDGGWERLLDAVIGMAAMWTVFFVLWFIYPAGMGFGDVKLSGILGLYLGWFGLDVVLIGGFAGFLLAGAYGLVLVLAGKATRKTAIPFGPFMMLGALLIVVAPALVLLFSA
ncbi:MAG: prepilin peptidase [Streptosporangiales bacterium]|nr:prepilin peptidase [Streptosporangiales bacterium]